MNNKHYSAYMNKGLPDSQRYCTSRYLGFMWHGSPNIRLDACTLHATLPSHLGQATKACMISNVR